MLEDYQGHKPKIDPKAYVHHSAVIIGKVSVGPSSSVWPNTTIRGDDGSISIGANTSIQDNSVVHLTHDLSNTVVGDRCTVGHRVILHGCHVEDNCLIGMGAILLDNCHIGHHSLIGAGALVLQRTKIPPYSLVLGSPAKVIRPLNETERAQLEFSWKNYAEKAALLTGSNA